MAFHVGLSILPYTATELIVLSSLIYAINVFVHPLVVEYWGTVYKDAVWWSLSRTPCNLFRHDGWDQGGSHGQVRRTLWSWMDCQVVGGMESCIGREVSTFLACSPGKLWYHSLSWRLDMEQAGHRSLVHTPGSRNLPEGLDFSTDFLFSDLAAYQKGI